MSRRRILASWAMLSTLLAAMVLASGASSAHLPIYGSGGTTLETALKIPDANVSYAIYAEYSSSVDRIHVYAFSVEAGHSLNFQLAVPAIPDLENFAPVILLIGPGLQAPDGYTSALLSEFSISLGAGQGALSYVYNGTSNENEFEPFTQTNMWVRQDTEVQLPLQGVYYLAVVVPEGSAQDAVSGFGKYVLAPGKLERFSIPDYMAIPIDWMKTHAFWDQSVLVFMLPTFVVVALGTAGTWYYVSRRKPEFLGGKTTAFRIAFFGVVIGATLMIGSCVNQLFLVFTYAGFDFGVGELIVFMLQTIGLVLGLLALRMGFTLSRRRSVVGTALSLILVALMAFIALVVGSGWLLGPVLFLVAAYSETALGRSEDRKQAAA